MNTPCKNQSVIQRRMTPGSADKENSGFLLLRSPSNSFNSPAKLSDENTMLPPDFQSLLSGDIVNDQVSHNSSSSSEFRFPTHFNFKNNVEKQETPSRQCRSLSMSSVNCRTPKTNDGLMPLANHDSNANKRVADNSLLDDEFSPFIKRHKILDENAEYKLALKKRNSISHSPIVHTKSTLYDYGFNVLPCRSKFLRCYSDSGDVKTALNRSNLDANLIGDFSRPFFLPIIRGQHDDLKSISCDTLAKLINGDFNGDIGSFQIIDCRYPYEYKGGHIKGAKNIFTEEEILKEFVDNKKSNFGREAKRSVLIFHCEFSSERGPKLSRFLRKKDRLNNSYPDLHYPEMYLLHGGYKAFFEKYSALCEPCSYLPMIHPDYEEDLRHFRSKSKTWCAGMPNGSRASLKSSFRRLGFN